MKTIEDVVCTQDQAVRLARLLSRPKCREKVGEINTPMIWVCELKPALLPQIKGWSIATSYHLKEAYWMVPMFPAFTAEELLEYIMMFTSEFKSEVCNGFLQCSTANQDYLVSRKLPCTEAQARADLLIMILEDFLDEKKEKNG